MVEIVIGIKDKPNLLKKSIISGVLHVDSFYILCMRILPVVFYVYDKSEEGIELSKFIKTSMDTPKQMEEKGIELLLKYANVEDFFAIINEHYKNERNNRHYKKHLTRTYTTSRTKSFR